MMKVVVCIIVGAILGAMVGQFDGLPWGAVAGAVVGVMLFGGRKSGKDPDLDAKMEHIYRSLADIHMRLTALEAGQVRGSEMLAPSATSPAGTETEGVPAAPRPEAAQPPVAPGPLAAPAAARDATEEAAAEAGEPVPAPFAPPAPPALAGIFGFIRDWFTGGNTVVRVGVIVLIFGVGFLLKYAAERTELPIELRLVGVAVGALALLFLGWRQRTRRRGFAIAVQGGGVAILYLVVIAAFRLYHVLPAGAAFALLVGIVVCSAALAVLEDAVALAALGVTGGFLAPILTSTETGNHVALFAYYTLLNAGILGIAWFRAWRSLNLLGFLFTALIGSLWGYRAWRPELFASTEPFVVLFFAFYLAIALLHARLQAREMRQVIDGTLLFGTPLVAFGWQAAMLREQRFALALSAVAVSGVYLVLGRALQRRAEMRLMLESFLALGVVFATLAIPLALDARWTSAAWALEGSAIVWLGVRQERLLARIFGMLLQPLAAAAFVMSAAFNEGGTHAVFNAFCLGTLFIAFGGLVIAWLLHRHRERVRPTEVTAGHLFFAWGLLWWLGGGVHEIVTYVTPDYDTPALVVFLAASAFACSIAARVSDWRAPLVPALALPAVLALAALIAATFLPHPAVDLGWLGWPVAFAINYVLLRRHEDVRAELAALNHCLALWVPTALLTWEMAWQMQRVLPQGVWSVISWALLPAAVLLGLSALAFRERWPFASQGRIYLVFASGAIAIYLLAWGLFANFTLDGSAAPLPYLPLLNPLDIALAFALLAVAGWARALVNAGLLRTASDGLRIMVIVLAACLFVWLTAILLRSMHHWTGVPYDLDALLGSMAVQSALSVFWSLLALAAMVFAVRTARRAIWVTGAVLLAVVVAKLFFVDLSHVSGVARIVSFIGVGVLLLVIGYFAPVPPRAPAMQEA
jgi:uncharacterized membrane protein